MTVDQGFTEHGRDCLEAAGLEYRLLLAQSALRDLLPWARRGGGGTYAGQPVIDRAEAALRRSEMP